MKPWCSKLCAFLHIAQGAGCWLVMRNGCSPTRGGSPARCCFRGGSDKELLPWLCDAASEDMDVLFGSGVSTWTLVDDGLGAAVFEGRQRSVKGDLHEGVQDIGWGRMSRTYCVGVCDRSEDFIEDQAC